MEEENNNNISKNIEDFKCLACGKIKQRRGTAQRSKRLPIGVMKYGSTTCSIRCRQKARDMRYTKRDASNLKKANNNHRTMKEDAYELSHVIEVGLRTESLPPESGDTQSHGNKNMEDNPKSI